MQLLSPSIKFKDSFLIAIKALQAEGRNMELNVTELEKKFESYIAGLEKEAKGEDLTGGRVQQTLLWAIDNDEYVGRVKIRHYLNENLLKHGGNIGYEVVPSKRLQGYGSQILQQALPILKQMGILKVKIDCAEDNIASKKIIEKAGGIFEKAVLLPEENITVLHFWIYLEKY